MCCGICLDKIRLNPDSKDKRFGILRKFVFVMWRMLSTNHQVGLGSSDLRGEGSVKSSIFAIVFFFFFNVAECNHPFCLTCIRKWRSSSKTKDKFVR